MKVKTFLIRALKILSILLAIFFFISLSQKYIFRYNNRDSLRVDGFRMEEKDSLDGHSIPYFLLLIIVIIEYGFRFRYTMLRENL